MDLVLVRHAEPVRITAEAGGGGPVDPVLTDRGLDQAHRLARWLAPEPIHHIVSSPLARATQTAAPLSTALALDVEIIDGLREYDSDSDSYIPVEELRAAKDPRWDAMVRGDWQSFGGEPPDEFRARIVGQMDALIENNRGRTVVIVCHGGVVNIYLGAILGITTPLWFDPAYTSISRVRANARGLRSVTSVNEVGHLLGSRDVK